MQVGSGLLQHYNGQASHLVQAAQHSAVALVQLLTAHFPGFRDHAVYKGRQVRGGCGARVGKHIPVQGVNLRHSS